MRTSRKPIVRGIGALLLAACLATTGGCPHRRVVGGARKVKPSFPVGRELSAVPGVSIVCEDRANGGGSRFSGSGQRATLHSEGQEFMDCLRNVAGRDWAFVVRGDVPQGYFQIDAHTDYGGQDQLARLVCQAFTEAGKWRVSPRLVLTEVTALTCPDPAALGFPRVGRRAGGSSGSGSGGGSRHIDGTGTMARFARALTDNMGSATGGPGTSPRSSSDIFVDETGIAGNVKYELKWPDGDRAELLAALLRNGIAPVPRQRLIRAIVVEPKTSPATGPSTLLGLSEGRMLEILSAPSQRTNGPKRGQLQYLYGEEGSEARIDVADGYVTVVELHGQSKMELEGGIAIGTPMQLVTELCGSITSEKEVDSEQHWSDTEGRVLYRSKKDGSSTLTYPSPGLHFWFSPDRTVQAIRIGSPRSFLRDYY